MQGAQGLKSMKLTLGSGGVATGRVDRYRGPGVIRVSAVPSSPLYARIRKLFAPAGRPGPRSLPNSSRRMASLRVRRDSMVSDPSVVPITVYLGAQVRAAGDAGMVHGWNLPAQASAPLELKPADHGALFAQPEWERDRKHAGPCMMDPARTTKWGRPLAA